MTHPSELLKHQEVPELDALLLDRPVKENYLTPHLLTPQLSLPFHTYAVSYNA